MKTTKGFIHSTESFGTVDGPGIRFVVFLQGCPMRCKYCHNPDTWEIGGGTEVTVQELMELYDKNKAFYHNGGITVTGGEPLLQVDFLIELFRMAKDKGVHTCIDTSGITYKEGESEYNKKLDELLAITDLVMLDIKHIDPKGHLELTGKDNAGILAFAYHLEELGVPVWIRHVIVEGITDDEAELKELGHTIGKLKNLKGLDVLPYHSMGVNKYKELGLEYPLEGMQALPKEKAVWAKSIILAAIHEVRHN